MVTNTTHQGTVTPIRCTFCNKPLRPRDGHIEAWRSPSGQYFCTEFCADDAEEAQFQMERRASSDVGFDVTAGYGLRTR
jgi:hypothetical protein